MTMGYSRKNPQLPDRWVSRNSLKSGVKGSENPGKGGREEEVEPKKSSSGIISK